MKTNIFLFLTTFLVPLKTIPADELKNLLPVLYSNFEDKNHKVREASEKVVLGFMMHLGYASMYAACEELKVLLIFIKSTEKNFLVKKFTF